MTIRDELLEYWVNNMLRETQYPTYGIRFIGSMFTYKTCNMLLEKDIEIERKIDLSKLSKILFINIEDMEYALQRAWYSGEFDAFGNILYRLDYRKKGEKDYYPKCLEAIEKYVGIKIEPVEHSRKFKHVR